MSSYPPQQYKPHVTVMARECSPSILVSTQHLTRFSMFTSYPHTYVALPTWMAQPSIYPHLIFLSYNVIVPQLLSAGYVGLDGAVNDSMLVVQPFKRGVGMSVRLSQVVPVVSLTAGSIASRLGRNEYTDTAIQCQSCRSRFACTSTGRSTVMGDQERSPYIRIDIIH